MEPWLKNQLIQTGRMSETGLTRNARIHTCPRCKTPTIAGYDADRAALDVWCDTTELNPTHELEALLSGRETYTLTPSSSHNHKLNRRDQFNVTQTPKHPLLATHLCHDPIPAAWEQPANPNNTPKSAPPMNTDPKTIPF